MNVDNISRQEALKERIKALKEQKGAVILAHYYTLPEIQDVADYVGDSLALAVKAQGLDCRIIVLCGVHFMGETAKILCPDKIVLVPDMNAGCSLADSCPADRFGEFVRSHPDHTVVSYVNTSAAVKALTDVVVTSSNALKIVSALPEDAKIIFGPDRNLGNYVASMTGRQMKIWDGACHVHEKFSLDGILKLKKEYPDAKLLVHPECPAPIRMLADVCGSTAAILDYAVKSDAKNFIVVTESGILHKMRLACPDKNFIPAPAEDGECGCNNCAYMKLNTLEKLADALEKEQPQIEVDPETASRAIRPILKMIEMSK